MSEQPEALRWAAILEHQAQYDGPTDYKHKAAAELRRLLAENTEIKTLNDDLYRQGLAAINEKHELLDAAVKAEREACALLCEETRFPDSYTAIRCAAAIRARGET